MMDMVHRRTFILCIPCVQALSDLCEALISCDALFLHDGGLHCHLETAFLVGGERRRGAGGKKCKWREEWGREGKGRTGEVRGGGERKRETRRVKRGIEVGGEDKWKLGEMERGDEEGESGGGRRGKWDTHTHTHTQHTHTHTHTQHTHTHLHKPGGEFLKPLCHLLISELLHNKHHLRRGRPVQVVLTCRVFSLTLLQNMVTPGVVGVGVGVCVCVCVRVCVCVCVL